VNRIVDGEDIGFAGLALSDLQCVPRFQALDLADFELEQITGPESIVSQVNLTKVPGQAAEFKVHNLLSFLEIEHKKNQAEHKDRSRSGIDLSSFVCSGLVTGCLT
jgi:hypothetical protein